MVDEEDDSDWTRGALLRLLAPSPDEQIESQALADAEAFIAALEASGRQLKYSRPSWTARVERLGVHLQGHRPTVA